jgi:hemerythrin-like metal-binding protein
MQFITWTKSLSVGIKEIDDQHKTFIGCLNEAAAISDSPQSNRNKLEILIARILDYVRYHFDTEEKYFKKYNYPYAEEHILEHAKLLENAAKFYDRFKLGDDVTAEFLLFLKDWLENHLKTHDMKYARYFKKIGVKEY